MSDEVLHGGKNGVTALYRPAGTVVVSKYIAGTISRRATEFSPVRIVGWFTGAD